MPEPDAVGRRPLFSILTSVYRTERYLAETIESVLAQTLPDWELIVVDNGMSDEVVRIVERYARDPRIRLLRQENRGLGGGVDAAAAAARGQYFAVLDSDDLLMPQFCERTAAVLAAHPSIDAVGIDAAIFTDGDTHDQIRSYRRSVGATAEVGLHRRVTLAEMVGGEVLYYTAAIRADAWALGRGYTCDTPKVEDLALFMRMLIAGCDIRVLNERLARYRVRRDSSSRSNEQVELFEQNLERAFRKATLFSDAPDVHLALTATLRRIRYDQSMRRARAALLNDDVIAALEHAKHAFAQRRSARPAAVAAGLMLAPGVLRRIHPAKQRITRIAVVTVRSARGLLKQGMRRSTT
ncbi:glycosyltransferase family A protein [Pseudonocardia sp. CA-107938]|uniref:glycosyltransferase family A protein n=1 Tax=Pseudonocardia sp. CA-107938 TaxID=3240021 RepID=UPI003D93AEC5